MNQMDGLNYTPVPRLSRENILSSVSSGKPEEIRDALVSASYWDEDWEWAQQQLLNFADHDDNLVLWAVVAGLGFIAAFHGEISEDKVMPVLNRLKSNPVLANDVEETMEEIEHFVRRRKRGEDIELGQRLPEDWRPQG